jgi:hypothetical protein
MSGYPDDPHLVEPGLERIDRAVSSLPRYFRSAVADGAIAVVAGNGDWTGPLESALAGNRRAVVLVQPGFAEPVTVLDLAERATARGVPVLVDYACASNPAVVAAADTWRTTVGPIGVLEVTSGHGLDAGHDSIAILLDQLAAIRALLGPVGRLRQLGISGGAHTAVLTVPVTGGELIASLIAAPTEAWGRGTRMRWLGATEALELEVPDDTTARPAQVRHVTEAGEHLTPTIYENANRATLLALWSQLRTNSGAGDDLTVLAAHLALVDPERHS